MSAPYFSETRNVELSTLYYIETQIDASWSAINVVKSFKQAYDVNVPVVCIGLQDTTSARKEIGSLTLNNVHGISIDIFARSDGQRIDLADFILNKIRLSYPYYTHSQTAGVLSRTAVGRCTFLDITENRKIEFIGDVEFHDRFRHILNYRVEYRT